MLVYDDVNACLDAYWSSFFKLIYLTYLRKTYVRNTTYQNVFVVKEKSIHFT